MALAFLMESMTLFTPSTAGAITLDIASSTLLYTLHSQAHNTRIYMCVYIYSILFSSMQHTVQPAQSARAIKLQNRRLQPHQFHTAHEGKATVGKVLCQYSALLHYLGYTYPYCTGEATWKT